MTIKAKKMCLYVMCTALLFGCAQNEVLKSNTPHAVNSQGKTADDVKSRETYHIKSGDMLIIKVYPGEEFAQPLELEVDAEGDINIPLLNRISVGGKTPVEAEKFIASQLDEKYIVNPSVSLRVKQYHLRTVVVLGEVKRPGTYEFPPNGRLSVMKAIALAGGFTDIAAIDRVKLLRKAGEKQEVSQINVKDIINGKSKDVDVEPDDLITVPETFF